MNPTMKKLENLFNNSDLGTRLLGSNYNHFKHVYQDIMADILLLEKEQDPVADYKKILDLVRQIKQWVSFEHATAEQLSMLRDFSMLIFNWNNSGYQNKLISMGCHSIRDIIDGNLTMRDVINITKEVTKRMAEMKSWNPPAFEISKSFMESMK